MSATIRLHFESVQSASEKPLGPTPMVLWARCKENLSVLAPLIRFCGIYSLGVATCFPAWKAFENSMSLIGLGLLGVAFLLMLCSFETTGNAIGSDDLI
jgi:hypothetical protein